MAVSHTSLVDSPYTPIENRVSLKRVTVIQALTKHQSFAFPLIYCPSPNVFHLEILYSYPSRGGTTCHEVDFSFVNVLSSPSSD